jgi:hypothetical protein
VKAVRLRQGSHNQGDEAASPDSGWDVQCLTERSSDAQPNWADRHKSRMLKGLAIDWNPDVLDVRRKDSFIAHYGIPKVTPNRGTLWIEATLTTAAWIDVAVVCSHRINDNDGSDHPVTKWIRRRRWDRHDRKDRRLFRRLERRGFLVLYGGDINDRTAGIEPLVRELNGRYDALGHSVDKRLRLCGITTGGRDGSDHQRFTATYEIKE